MPPEYAVHGSFSAKSEAISFGCNCIGGNSGRKNRRVSHPAHHLNLLGHGSLKDE